MKTSKILSVAIVLIILFTSFTEQKPRILIIGDSISNGYMPFVEKYFADKAIVKHNPGNAQHSGFGLQKIREWIGDEKWDIIQFNWGLHDLCYRSPQSKVYGNRDKINGKITFTPEEYGKNLEELVLRLKKTGAKLIFATTTYVPQGEAGRFTDDVKRYNDLALNIMKKHNIQVNSLNNISKKIHKKHLLAEGDVHYSARGYELLAEPVIEIITKNL